MNSTKSNRKSPSSKPADSAKQQVDVTEFQTLDGRQLDALVSQLKLELPDDANDGEKIHAIINYHAANAHSLVGSGTLQVLPDGFGFLRSRWFNYLGGPDDIYVSPSQIRKFQLTNGDMIKGQIRPPKENERFFALLRIFEVNHLDPEEAKSAPDFEEIKALSPVERVQLDSDQLGDTSRVIDLVAPVGLGQRGVIVGPPRSGKTRLIAELCESMLEKQTNLYAFMLLVDQRPEEITDLENRLNGQRCEVISSVFDDASQRHHDVSMMVLERAKRMVELGGDVVLFLDSLTNLARFELGPGCSPEQIKPDLLSNTRSFLAAAKRTEEAGSLTIISTLTVDSSNEVDNIVAEVLRSSANMEIRLDAELVKRRVWPSVNIHESQTQQEEQLLGEKYDYVCKLRRSLGDLTAVEAMESLLGKLNEAAK